MGVRTLSNENLLDFLCFALLVELTSFCVERVLSVEIVVTLRNCSNITKKRVKLAFAFAGAEDVGVIVDYLSFFGLHLLHNSDPFHHTNFALHRTCRFHAEDTVSLPEN